MSRSTIVGRLLQRFALGDSRASSDGELLRLLLALLELLLRPVLLLSLLLALLQRSRALARGSRCGWGGDGRGKRHRAAGSLGFGVLRSARVIRGGGEKRAGRAPAGGNRDVPAEALVAVDLIWRRRQGLIRQRLMILNVSAAVVVVPGAEMAPQGERVELEREGLVRIELALHAGRATARGADAGAVVAAGQLGARVAVAVLVEDRGLLGAAAILDLELGAKAVVADDVGGRLRDPHPGRAGIDDGHDPIGIGARAGAGYRRLADGGEQLARLCVWELEVAIPGHAVDRGAEGVEDIRCRQNCAAVEVGVG